MDCTTLKSLSPSSAASVTVLVPFCTTPGGTLNVLVTFAWLLKLITPSDAPFNATLTLCGWPSVVPCSVTSSSAGIEEVESRFSISERLVDRLGIDHCAKEVVVVDRRSATRQYRWCAVRRVTAGGEARNVAVPSPFGPVGIRLPACDPLISQ